MTGRELRDKLNDLTEAELDLTVYGYCQRTEDGAFVDRVIIRSFDEEPYEKGDGPWRSGDADSNERLIYIE